MNDENLTRFPGGVAQFSFYARGGAAGEITVNGVKKSDKLLLVQALAPTSGTFATAEDVTDEFTITADKKIDNTGGTATTDNMLVVTVARTIDEG